MSFSKSTLAYPDIKDYFERAIDTERGIKITCADEKAATMYKHRINYFRVLHRKDNQRVYPEGHPLHGRSPYDVFVIKQRGCEIHLEKMTLNPHQSEDL